MSPKIGENVAVISKSSTEQKERKKIHYVIRVPSFFTRKLSSPSVLPTILSWNFLMSAIPNVLFFLLHEYIAKI
uniref:Uncharacterized protein n=1 Tax=Ascaris lumbricoides TaxID=6252 RepID=A0A0M3HGA0_ASCLU